jgi:hypothetical protein
MRFMCLRFSGYQRFVIQKDFLGKIQDPYTPYRSVHVRLTCTQDTSHTTNTYLKLNENGDPAHPKSLLGLMQEWSAVGLNEEQWKEIHGTDITASCVGDVRVEIVDAQPPDEYSAWME